MKIENNFFPLIAGELGDSKKSCRQLQARLDDFLPVFTVGTLHNFVTLVLSRRVFLCAMVSFNVF